MTDRAKPWYAGLSEKERARELRVNDQQRAVLIELAQKAMTVRELVLLATAETRRINATWDRPAYALYYLSVDGARGAITRLQRRGLVDRRESDGRWFTTAKGRAALR